MIYHRRIRKLKLTLLKMLYHTVKCKFNCKITLTKCTNYLCTFKKFYAFIYKTFYTCYLGTFNYWVNKIKIMEDLYTLIWNAIFSPKWRKNQRCSGINFFGLITCYRPGSNQIRRNLLLKTYLNNFPWCVNLGKFHFLLKFLNSYIVTPLENWKVLFA